MNDKEMLAKLHPVISPRIKKLDEVKKMVECLYSPHERSKSKLTGKLNSCVVKNILLEFKQQLLANYDQKDLEAWFRFYLSSKYNMKMKDVVQPVRVALTGEEVTLPLFSGIIDVLDKDECVRRIDEAIEILEENSV